LNDKNIADNRPGHRRYHDCGGQPSPEAVPISIYVPLSLVCFDVLQLFNINSLVLYKLP
jgi:hypothetical protein